MITLRASLALFAAALGPVGAPPAAAEAVETAEERVSVRLVRLPVLLREEEPGGCAGLRDDAIEVREDGARVGAAHLDPVPLEAAHAILVDAGPAMLESLQDARRAALAYASALPAGEPALLATFDHRLLLHAAWTSDRSRLAEAASRIEIGARSDLWQSTRTLIRLLRSRPARKALIVLTRGCDSGEEGVTVEDVLEAAAETESLSVFPVGIGLPARCESTGADPLAALRELAERTGGELHLVDAGTPLEPVLEAIRRRLGREMVVVYAPPPFGSGPKDRPAKLAGRWRRIRAQLRGTAGCALSVAGAGVRCESAAGAGGCSADARRPVSLLRAFSLAPGGDVLDGEVRDILEDGGVVAPPLDALLAGKPAPASDRPSRLAARSASAPVPPLDELLRPGAGHADVFLRALARASRLGTEGSPAADEAPPPSWSDAPFLVNGETLLDVRGSLASALARHPDYQRWAAERARKGRLGELDRSIGQCPPGRERTLLERARAVVAEAPVVLEPREAEDLLGAWLGDVPAAQVFQAAESWLAGRLLEAARSGEGLAAAWAEVERLWTLLGRWVPASGAVRTVGWLFPGYDPDQEVVGYYRVVIAQPYSADIKDMFLNAAPGAFLGSTGVSDPAQPDALFDRLQSFNHSREAPLGARLLRWMLEQDEVARLLVAHYDVGAVRYGHSDVRDLFAALSEARLVGTRAGALPARQVSLVLKRRDGSARELTLGAYFPLRGRLPREYGAEPLCLVLFPETVESEADRSLVRAVSDVPRAMPCILR
jgi:hypothetical protein